MASVMRYLRFEITTSRINSLLIRAVIGLLFLFACSPIKEEYLLDKISTNTLPPLPEETTGPIPSFSPMPSFTLTLSPTHTFTQTLTPTITLTPTPSATFTVTFTPTFDFPDVVVKMQAHCRYGPARAFLHAADLYPGDHGTVRGRFQYSAWLYVKFDKLNYFCWVSPSVVDVNGDITRVYFTRPRLPGPSVLYPPPSNVQAIRDGTQVTVSWSRVSMTEDDDRGYMLDVFLCQQGNLVWWPVGLSDQYQTSYTFTDEPGCAQPSGGVLYTVEKHGYSQPANIPWPVP